MSKMNRVLEKGDMDKFFKELSEEYRIFGPMKKGSEFIFREVKTADELCLDYISTILPPKKFFHPPRETLFLFTKEDGFTFKEVKMDEKIVLFGIHPCDVNAILRLDKLFSKDFEDPYYLKRRKNTIIVALNCIKLGENCFCSSMGTGPYLEKGYDILLTDIGEKYLVEIGSDAGKNILNGLKLGEARDADFAEKEKRLKIAKGKFEKFVDATNLAEIARANMNNEIWRDLAERGVEGSFPCLSCGSCSLVCPTCYCYEVYDVMDISLKEGERRRELDSCQLLEYGEVALGGNFRKDRKDRIRHWMMCKFGAAAGGIYSSCIGCGRCIWACPAGIDITKIARKIRGG